MTRSTYSRRSSSSSSGRSSRVSVESQDVNVPRWKGMRALIYLADGDPIKYKHLRREVAQVPRSNGTYETKERFLMVRDPVSYTDYFFYEDDGSSQYGGSRSGRRSSKSGRSSHGPSRAPSVRGGVPPMPQPPPQHHMPGGPWAGPGGPGGPGPGMGMPPMGGGPMGGMPPMGGGMHPMGGPMGGPMGPGGPEIVDGMDPDDDSYSDYSGSSSGSEYMSEYDEFPQMVPPGMGHMPPPNMGHMPPQGMGMPMPMPPMNAPPPMMHPPPQQGGGLGADGPGFIQIG